MRTDIRYLAVFVLVMALPLVLGSGCSTSNQSGASAPRAVTLTKAKILASVARHLTTRVLNTTKVAKESSRIRSSASTTATTRCETARG